MLQYLYAFFFGCFHSKTTFPMTVTSRSPLNGEITQRTYVACLTCGEEIAYNWDKMRIEGKSVNRPVLAPALISIAQGRSNVYRKLLPAAERPTLTHVQAGR